MIETSGKWGALMKDVGVQITDLFDQGFTSYMPGILSILHYETSDKMQEHYTDVTDFTGFGLREEADNANQMSRFKGFDSSWEVSPTSGFVTITYESMYSNAFKAELAVAEKAGRAAARYRDQLGYLLLTKGFDNNNRNHSVGTGVSAKGFVVNWFNDGKPQFSVSHPSAVPGGSSQSNASSSGITLSEDNLEVAELAIEFQTQDNGELLDHSGSLLIAVPTNLRREARIILETEREVGSEYNDINIYEGGVFDLYSSKYLGSKNGGLDTNWFAIDKNYHKLFFIDQESAAIEDEYNMRNRTFNYAIHTTQAVASKNWKYTWASKGNAGSYSS